MGKCVYCKSDNVKTLDVEEVIKYKEHELKVFMLYSFCSNCENEYVPKDQILINEARVRDAKKIADGLLSSKEIYHARIKLGITQEEASIIFGGGKNAFSKYERAEVSQSTAMDKLIKIALKYEHVFNDLVNEEKLTLKNKLEKSKAVQKKVLVSSGSEVGGVWDRYIDLPSEVPVVACNDESYHMPEGYVSVKKGNLRVVGWA